MENRMKQFQTIAAQPDGPVKKFQLCKAFGGMLRESTAEDIRTWDCQRLESEIAKRLSR